MMVWKLYHNLMGRQNKVSSSYRERAIEALQVAYDLHPPSEAWVSLGDAHMRKAFEVLCEEGFAEKRNTTIAEQGMFRFRLRK